MDIENNSQQIINVIELEISTDDIGGMMDKLNRLVNISGLSAKNVSYAKEKWRSHQVEAIRQHTEQVGNLPASTFNELIKAYCGKYESLFDLAERTDKRLSYAIEGLRSMISLYKTELEHSLRQ